ncbi:hypothetical protein Dimus_027163, partial [Dionaea muscipula]
MLGIDRVDESRRNRHKSVSGLALGFEQGRPELGYLTEASNSNPTEYFAIPETILAPPLSFKTTIPFFLQVSTYYASGEFFTKDHISFLLCDYRQLPDTQKYDRIISCEMIEHVGHEYYEEFFSCCGSALAENGLLVLQ